MKIAIKAAPRKFLAGSPRPKAWPVPGYFKLNSKDKPGEGDGKFGQPRANGTHKGIDIQAPSGAKVVASGDGKVVDIKPNPSATYGNQVVIDHGQGVFTQSAHLDSATVKPGEMVTAGQEIGAVGRTGNTPSSGDTHLHFEVRVGGPSPSVAGGKVADPLTKLSSPTPPETTREN